MRTLKIGVTGGIGSGKSYVCSLLERQFHLPLYNCDNEAKRLNNESPVIRQGLIERVGPDVYQPNGELNRGRLADYLFQSPAHAAQINELIHPQVKADFQQWCERQQAPIVVMECAILFESHFDELTDYTITVKAPLSLRIERIRQRDGATDAQIAHRMKLQSDEEVKAKLADFIIVNDGNEALEPQLEAILAKL